MAKDKSNGSGGKVLAETDSVKRKKESILEKKSKKMKPEQDSEQEVPELLVNEKKTRTPKKRSRAGRTVKMEVEEEEEEEEATEPAQEGEELSAEESRVLERKLKKIRKKDEKAQLKAEGKTVEKVVPEKASPSQQALDYLTCWNEDRAAWKFQKLRQTWLLQQIYELEQVPDESFPVLLLYLEGMQGTARKLTVEQAEALVKGLGEGPWDKEQQSKMKRAREVLQLLS